MITNDIYYSMFGLLILNPCNPYVFYTPFVSHTDGTGFQAGYSNCSWDRFAKFAKFIIFYEQY